MYIVVNRQLLAFRGKYPVNDKPNQAKSGITFWVRFDDASTYVRVLKLLIISSWFEDNLFLDPNVKNFLELSLMPLKS